MSPRSGMSSVPCGDAQLVSSPHRACRRKNKFGAPAAATACRDLSGHLRSHRLPRGSRRSQVPRYTKEREDVCHGKNCVTCTTAVACAVTRLPSLVYDMSCDGPPSRDARCLVHEPVFLARSPPGVCMRVAASVAASRFGPPVPLSRSTWGRRLSEQGALSSD